MKSYPTGVLMVMGLLCFSGCGDSGLGGGAYQATSVVVLPPDLSADAESDTNVESGADNSVAASPGSVPGNFRGRIVLTGSAPTLSLIHAKGANIKDAVVCSAEDMPNEKLLIGANNGVANVFINIRKVPKGTPKPSPTEEAVLFDQKNCRFLPHCLVVPTNQLVKVLSNDSVSHNTHSYPTKNDGINQTVTPGDRDGNLQFVYTVSERQPVKVSCDFHTWMNAWHLPVDHPFAALSDADGNFEINDLPAGNHEFTVWHEAAKGKFVNRKLKVTIRASQTTTEEIEYAASLLAL